VGAGVYLATVRSGQHEASLGFGTDAAEAPSEGTPAPGAGPGYAYLRISTQGPSAAERLQGFVGILVLIALGSAALAFAIYEAGHLINRMLESFLGS
jgi:hypothetical protein